MAVGFITGRLGADRTDKILDLCFKEAKREDKKPIYILVPEKFTYEMEKSIKENPEDMEEGYHFLLVLSLIHI